MNKGIRLAITTGIVLIVFTVGSFKFFERIDNGYVGVRYSMNGGVRDEVLTQGVKFVGLDYVTQYPTRLQTIYSKNIAVSTKDSKKTVVSIKYDYKVDATKASKMYKEFGNITSEDIEKGWLKSKLQKEAREVYSKFTLLEILSGKSSVVESELLKQFSKSVETKGFVVEDVTVGVPEVDKETQKSIDSIIQAGQENEKAKLESETLKTRADAKYYEKVKQAESEREANKKLSESITPEVIKLKEAEARLKHGWVEVQTGEAIVNKSK
ncbi:SPFH domain-containing protein [Peptostreptococcus faecalis]|uniref:SPFH domain-containing protein n=1 Tax=Peptostreptococcus faecalis TaxID=2045015 RepID=UPI000C79E223|nr:SPFH domain-containing protein [Peptostreptococcus faecalis]